VLGGRKRILSYRYPTREEEEAFLDAKRKKETEKSERERKALEARNEAIIQGQNKQQRENEQQRERVIAFQFQQASNGLPGFQYEVGLRYLTGTGLAKDNAAAAKWLKLAAEQGHKEAIEKLSELQREAEKPAK
jgi:TPR repeat protein